MAKRTGSVFRYYYIRIYRPGEKKGGAPVRKTPAMRVSDHDAHGFRPPVFSLYCLIWLIAIVCCCGLPADLLQAGSLAEAAWSADNRLAGQRLFALSSTILAGLTVSKSK